VAGRHRKVHSSASPRHRKPPRRGHVLLPTLAAAAILGVGGVGASAALSGGGDHPAGTPRVVQPVVPTPVSISPSPVVTTTPPAAVVPAAKPLPDFAITVTGRACWIQVVGPRGRVLIASVVHHGRTVTFPQRPLVVTLGDAGAARLVLHHHKQTHPAGRRGQVIRFTVR
jgi:hypothetical protein